MKKIHILSMVLALMVSACMFVACNDEKNNPEETAVLRSGVWQYTPDAENSMWFSFEDATFTYNDVVSVAGLTLSTWYEGTYLFKDNVVTLKFKKASSDDLKEAMAALPTTATLSGEKLLYNGHEFLHKKDKNN